MKLDVDQQAEIFSRIKQTILNGLEGKSPEILDSEDELLNSPAACFVTLTIEKQLRGCIGSLKATSPLIQDAMNNAYKAAFQDPRFPPMTEAETEELDIELSILTTPEPMDNIHAKEDLLAQLEPKQDGIILYDDFHRATFLPSVWKQLPDKEQFVDHLMFKAGLAEWHDKIRCERYSVEAYEAFWDDID